MTIPCPLALTTPDGHPIALADLPGIVPEIDPTAGPQPAAMSVILLAHGQPLVDLRCWSAPEAPNWDSTPILHIVGPYRLWVDVYAVPQPTPAGAHHEIKEALRALAAERPDHPGAVLPRLWTLLQARVRASAATAQAAADALRELAGDPDPLAEAIRELADLRARLDHPQMIVRLDVADLSGEISASIERHAVHIIAATDEALAIVTAERDKARQELAAIRAALTTSLDGSAVTG